MLTYSYFRDYDPQVGRYVDSDPIGLGGGANTYTYASGDPIDLQDFNGLEAVDAMRKLGWGVDSPIDDQSQCAGAAFWKNYNDMISANTIGADRYFHCKANCEASKCGKHGVTAACSMSNAREFTDTYIKYPFRNLFGLRRGLSHAAALADSAGDQAANAHGRNGANASPTASCSSTCSVYRPPGLSKRF